MIVAGIHAHLFMKVMTKNVFAKIAMHFLKKTVKKMTENIEYINRESLIRHLKQFAPESYSELINQLILKEPTADVAAVVLCKDCKKWSEHGFCEEFMRKLPTGGRIVFKTNENDYCSYGVRKDGE